MFAQRPAGTKRTYRGELSAYDFTQGDLTIDGAFHDLDLSAIAPVGAKAVGLRVRFSGPTVTDYIQFRHKGDTEVVNSFTCWVLAANNFHEQEGIVVLDANRVIEYKVVQTVLLLINGYVRYYDK